MIRRSLRCDECEFIWQEYVTNSDVPVPECPACAAAAKRIPGPFAITGTKSKAVDIAQQSMEEMGYSNFHDNQRVGDVAAMAPDPIQTAEAEAITRAIIEAGGVPEQQAPHLMEATKNFWQQGGGMVDPATAMAMGAPGAAAARAEGFDPIGLLHDAGKKGLMEMPLNVVSKVRGAGA